MAFMRVICIERSLHANLAILIAYVMYFLEA
jgi:hypothetical protein